MKCIKKSGQLFLWMLLGLLAGVFISTLISQIYDILYEHFPATFPLYNPVFERESYERFMLRMALVTVFLTFILTVYICQRFNNDRFEFIITKTEGLYKIRDILQTYISNFWLSDLVSSIICATVFTVPIHFIPNGFFTKSTFIVDILMPLRTIVGELGPTLSAICAAFALLLSHALTLPLILKFYRAKWLTGFAEGTV